MSLPIDGLGRPGDFASIDEKVNWLMATMDKIVRASQGGIETISDDYQVLNAPAVPRRSINPLTDTTQEVAETLATLLSDLHQRGVSGGPG